MNRPAPFVWITTDVETDRVSNVYFRREIELDAKPLSATIHIYAQTYYQLRVNGVVVRVGPARSYPEFPEYDSHDLSPWLRPGSNVVAVHAVHFSMPTFQHIPARAGLVCWGKIETRDGVVSLSTQSDWKCARAAGHDPNPPCFSFAIGPIEIVDERLNPAGWDLPGAPEGEWRAPVAVPDVWGALIPRTIPPLTRDELSPKELLGAWFHENDEVVHSFRMVDKIEPQSHPETRGFLQTWVHSPREQLVTVGMYWGEYYLNGAPIHKEPEKPEAYMRSEGVWRLREGWNYLFGSCGLVRGLWQLHLAAPRSAELVFSPHRKLDDSDAFQIAGPLPDAEGKAVMQRGDFGPEDARPELAAKWRHQPRLDHAVSPLNELAWARFGERLDLPNHATRDIDIESGRAVSLVFDMGAQHLGRVFLEVDAPAGTVFDVGFAEDMKGGRPWYGKNVLVHSAERRIVRGGASRVEFYHARGFRYLQLGVHHHDGPVRVRRVGMISQVYPHRKNGSFECSEPLFNILWAYGWRTLQLCSEDVITDCPWRERTLYGGDLLPETATLLVASGDARLVRRCVDIFLQSYSEKTQWLLSAAPKPRGEEGLYDYPLIVLLIADWYCRVSGDLEFARRAHPIFKTMLDNVWNAREANGLFPARFKVFVDWIAIKKHGAQGALNMLIARSFEAWASLLTMLGEPEEAAEAARRRDATAEAARRELWDDKVGAYCDTLVEGKKIEEHFIASSAWALAYGVASKEQTPDIIRFIKGKLADFHPDREQYLTGAYGGFYLLGALYEAGETAFAEDCVRRLWGVMVDAPTGTIWEHFNRGKSLVHAWSTAPNYFLSTRVLGVRLAFPDHAPLDEILIAPEAETVSWARGTVPHPLGPVRVEWRVRGDMLFLEYAAPKGVQPRIEPRGRLAKLTLVVNRIEE